MIDRATFDKAAAVLAADNHASEKDRKHHHYLTGSLYCGRCGSRMSLIQAKGSGGRYPDFFYIEKIHLALAEMREQAEGEATRQRRRLAKLDEERENKLRVFSPRACRSARSRSRSGGPRSG